MLEIALGMKSILLGIRNRPTFFDCETPLIELKPIGFHFTQKSYLTNQFEIA